MSGLLWFSLLIPFILAGVLLGILKLRKMTKRKSRISNYRFH